MDRRNWSVGSNRIKKLTPEKARNFKIFGSGWTLTTTFIANAPSEEDLSQVRGIGIAAIKNTWSGLPSGERAQRQNYFSSYMKNQVVTWWPWGISRGARNSDYEL